MKRVQTIYGKGLIEETEKTTGKYLIRLIKPNKKGRDWMKLHVTGNEKWDKDLNLAAFNKKDIRFLTTY